jgi:putative membrane associatehistidine kinase with HAMP domain protein
MKLSIRRKLMLLLLAIIAFISIMLAILNNFALGLYYRQRKVNELKKAYKKVDELIVNKEDNEIEDLIAEYSYKYNITIVLIDSVTSKAIISNERDGDYLVKRIQDILFDKSQKLYRILYNNYNCKIIQHHVDSVNTSFIDCIGYASDNQTMIIMSSSIESLKESIALSNGFMFYIVSLAVLLALISCFYVSLMITRPIKTLAKLSEQMGNFDFEAKYTGTSKDEIGILGCNMNLMSDSLKKAFDELKLANEKLQEDIKKKEEIDNMRKDFIANVSHELKTPISLIQGYAEGLNEGLCEDEESRKYYTEVIIDEANKMNIIVKQLLTLSALESGNQKLDISSFDMSELIAGVIETTGILLTDKNANIKFEAKKVLVKGDEFKVEEVLTNYISNAIHHVKENGKIEIKLIEKDKKLRISVFNEGKCIPDEDLTSIWEKFYKVDKAHSRSYGGSGIGLSIVKAIVEAHDNSCGVRNLENGVEFWFELDREIDQN